MVDGFSLKTTTPPHPNNIITQYACMQSRHLKQAQCATHAVSLPVTELQRSYGEDVGERINLMRGIPLLFLDSPDFFLLTVRL